MIDEFIQRVLTHGIGSGLSLDSSVSTMLVWEFIAAETFRFGPSRVAYCADMDCDSSKPYIGKTFPLRPRFFPGNNIVLFLKS